LAIQKNISNLSRVTAFRQVAVTYSYSNQLP
jgi:hypothetical protein